MCLNRSSVHFNADPLILPPSAAEEAEEAEGINSV